MSIAKQFKGKYVIKGVIRCKTGLHIGGSTEGIEIGGMDNPVIKDPLTGQPYIPGSSLKGKLRSIVEWQLGLIDRHSRHKNSKGQDSFAAYECLELKDPRDEAKDQDKWDKAFRLGKLFGPACDDTPVRERTSPTRLTVRDAFLSPASREKLEDELGQGVFTEAKTENNLDRVTSIAMPRSIERVPAGAEFDFTLLVDIYQDGQGNNDSDVELLHDLFGAMAILEDTALGGGGSRGHGQIAFEIKQVEWRPVDYYVKGAAPKTIAAAQGKTVRELAAGFKVQDWM